MRLAFLAAADVAARIGCRLQQRRRFYHRRRRKTSTLIQSGHFLLLDSILNPNIVHFPFELRIRSRALQRRLDDQENVSRSTFPVNHNWQQSATKATSKSWPFLAFWNLASLILLLLSTVSLALANGSSGMDQDSQETSCSLLEYFLSPSAPSSNIVRRSVDRTRSPFSAPANPDIDNVFAIWLRASQYGQSDSDAETSWPLQRPRHRYQRYRNGPGARAGSKESLGTAETTRRPRLNSTKSVGRPRPTPQSILPSGPSAKLFPQCKLFDERSANELCQLDVSKRVEALRHVYTQTSASPSADPNQSNNNANLTLYELFALGVSTDAQKSRPKVNHLYDGLKPCIISAGSASDGTKRNGTNVEQLDACRTCYRSLLERLNDIDSRHEAFTRSVLSMIDCEPDNDLEQFSPNSNCSECKRWYKRWLLVIFGGIWRQKPCVQWCHLTELACPHLPPVRRLDYAGLPSFRCSDPEVSGPLSPRNSTYGPACDCIHPCDTSAHTMQWGWDISAELTDFCGDYRKRDRNECPSERRSSAGTSKKAKPKQNQANGLHNGYWWFWLMILLGHFR